MELNKRIFGALAGVSYGDSLGMPVEFWSKDEIKKRFPKGIKEFYPTQKKDIHDNFRSLGKHEITDDTINTLAISKMLIMSHGKFDTSEYVSFLTNWINNDKEALKVVGPSTLSAVKTINNGADFHYTGRMGTTNGAIMKLVPIAVISNPNSIDNIVENVSKLCMPTHYTRTAIYSATVITRLISSYLANKSINDPLEFALNTIKMVRTNAFEDCQPSIVRRIQFVRNYINNHLQAETFDLLSDFLGTGVECIDTVISVLVILHYYSNPIQAAQTAVNIGGDTDTNASIVASIIGAKNPDTFIDNIDILDIEKVNNIDLHQIANQLKEIVGE